MHDGLQLGTLILVLFGILLNRYDFNSVRKDLDSKIDALRKEMDSKLEGIRREISEMRAEFSRKTETLLLIQSSHAERLTKLETKLEGGK